MLVVGGGLGGETGGTGRWTWGRGGAGVGERGWRRGCPRRGGALPLPKIETMTPAPLSPYAVSKLTCEHLMRVFASLYGIETVSLRYFNVFGPRQDPTSEYAAVIPKFITAAIRRERPTIFGDGEQTRD